MMIMIMVIVIIIVAIAAVVVAVGLQEVINSFNNKLPETTHIKVFIFKIKFQWKSRVNSNIF